MKTPYKLAYASSMAAIWAIAFATVVTILGEMWLPLKDLLKSVSGHHWTTKSILVVLIYVIGLIFYNSLNKEIDRKHLNKSLANLITITILGIVAITLFFTLNYFGVL